MVMQQHDPFRSAVSLRAMMDRLFDESFLPFSKIPSGGTLALDVTESDEVYTVKASLPGVKPEDVEITAHGDTITITGQTKTDEETKEKDYLIRERSTGSYTRTFTLPTAVDPDKAEAKFDDGILTLTVPKAETVKPKRIKLLDK